MVQPTLQLTDGQVRFYHENGYLSIPSLTTQEEIDSLVDVYDDLFTRKVGRETGDQFDLAGADEEGVQAALPQILGPSRYAPVLTQGLLFANACAVAKQLLGDGATFGGDHAIFKPAGHGAATPWHQDEAYWDPGLKYTSMSIWVPFQEATIDNGCMHFLPGTHRWEVMPHHSIGHDPRVHGLEFDATVDMSAAVPCPLPAGGATFHDSRTLHYAGPNTTNVPRRAYILGFGLPATPIEVPRDFYWNRAKQTARDERARSSRS